MKVMKFGGSSVKTADRIQRVKDIVVKSYENKEKLVVVVSALGGITDMLLNTAHMAAAGNEYYHEEADELYYRHRKVIEALFTDEERRKVLPFVKEKTRNLEKLFNGIYLIKECSPRVLDLVASYGELVSSYIIAHYIAKFVPETQFVDSRTVIKTDSRFMSARVDFEQTNSLLQNQINQPAGISVMGGFIASNHQSVTTTLGRGGSDYSAAIVAAGLEADEIEIWTDVNGVMTCDPRKVKTAFSIPTMTYEEALEMAHFGAKILHPPTVQPALSKGIPIRIRNTFEPEFSGTLITKETTDKKPVKGLSSISAIALLSVQGSGLIGVTGIAGRLFTTLADADVNIILITQASSEHSISFAILPQDIAKAKQALEKAFAFELRGGLIDPIAIEENLSVVAIVGLNMKNTIGISGQMFQTMAKNGINIRAIAQGSSELNISAVIRQTDQVKCLNALHEAFFLSKSVHIFLIGTGLIGKTLIEQIEQQQAYLQEKQSIELKLVAATNTRKMWFDERGMDLSTWQETLVDKGEPADLAAFIQKMKDLNLQNSILVDCTASKAPIPYYGEVLASSKSIVTPNKIANTGSYANYLNYKELARKSRVKFLYETNVGAGLPVISTLNDLLQSGDEIVKIEAVLSGSLSFIFNTFAHGGQFSEIVKEAGKRGYTEPDPREDLSGMDVARKVLILSREIGKVLELSDIEVENILPEACIAAPTVDDFFVALAANDAHFTELRDAAAAEGKVLRFLASIDAQKSEVVLKAVTADNPFYQLSGSDNMIVFTTARYHDRPLVVKGPGAGAEVTAAGVFAEIIRISNYLV